jgi:TetR/AcrR family transcriptional repressor of nem operon
MALYDAAIALFRNQGFAATSVEEIVGAAGVAKGTFFNFFPTKLHMLRAYYATIDVEIARCRARLDPAAPLPSLALYAEAVEHILRREGALMLELIEITLSDPAMRAIDEDSGAIDTDEFADFLRRAHVAGAIADDRDPQDAAEALLDLWSGAMRAWRRDPALSLANLFVRRAALLFRGLTAARR